MRKIYDILVEDYDEVKKIVNDSLIRDLSVLRDKISNTDCEFDIIGPIVIFRFADGTTGVMEQKAGHLHESLRGYFLANLVEMGIFTEEKIKEIRDFVHNKNQLKKEI